ncbi:hypothetical protein Poli38472_014417 [Pythium oligandrum]|uniref:Uncharacterized protein n=1 Tax=Pythium oligandrum TaxID=41045 RepID=A0A8K1C7C9_PYTOL|nr:hypothetical protein Poli38472_014417 [Pythium oligandrum]|eukprot:TMW57814.1 hypothetical protein Poli38472_014417 [Pythium oligandrum]
MVQSDVASEHGQRSPDKADEFAWLARLEQDMRNADTAIGAFVARLPQPSKRRAKSSSERGKAFRERRREHEQELEERILGLKNEVEELGMRRQAWEGIHLNTRMGVTGSLAQTIREYQRLFKYGLVELPSASSMVGKKRSHISDEVVKQVKLQEEFIRRVIDPDAIVGGTTGTEASITQWRLYTKSHSSMSSTITSMEVTGSEDCATVIERGVLTVRLSRGTFQMMFPHALADEDLIQSLVGKEVGYEYTKRFQFTSDAHISVESVDVSFVDGLLAAGVSMTDVTRLMAAASISSESMIDPDAENERVEVLDEEIKPPQSPNTQPCESPCSCEDPVDVSKSPSSPDRLSMAFLLSPDASGA